MDRSRYKRPATQKQRQTTKTTFGSPQPVPKGVQPRPQQFITGRRQPVDFEFRRRPRPISSRPAPTPPVPVERPLAANLPAMAVAASVSRQAPTPIEPAPSVPSAPILAARVPIDMDLPGEDSPSHFDLTKRHAKWRSLRRGAARTAAVAMVLLITMGGLLFSQSYFKMNKVFKGGAGTAAALKEDVKPELLKGEGRGRINILLLGRGGGTHDAPDLTDTIMLASIDPVNNTATLLSLPRDLWVNVPNQGVMKLNAAWQTGEFKYLGKVAPGSTDPKAVKAGFDMVNKTVSDVTGVTIDYNVMVDFQAFKQAVDTVGGVDVNVPADLVDPTMAWENGNNPLLAQAGPQKFDGKKALTYVRSRETTSDFARAERQRAMMLALKDKVQSLGTLSNPVKLSGLMNAFGNNVQTDLSVKNASRLYGILKKIEGAKVSSVGLTDIKTPGATPYVVGGNVNGQSIVLPKAGLFKYDDIRKFVRAQLKDPYIMKENARILVLNGTPQAGLATGKSDELRSYGYNVIRVGNTPSSGWTKTTLVDVSGGKKKYTKNYLEQRFSQKAVNRLDDTTIPTNGADFVIIVGSDEAPPTQSQTR